MIGKTISHYKITAKLGEGGMGVVYRARDTKLGREVAMKILPDRLAEDPRRLERFRREARAVASLSHPNIVTLHSIEEDNGVHYLTMELVEGRTLDKISEDGGLSGSELVALALRIAAGLAAAHRRGLTHRDLKPGNIMETRDRHTKILDFGLAKASEIESDDDSSDAATETLTREGHMVGTVAYMSPEQVQGQPVDPRSDIFSLGIVLYELVTGRHPFPGRSKGERISAILRDDPPSVSSLGVLSTGRLPEVIDRCLSKVPEDRFESAVELLAELEAVRNPQDLLRTEASPVITPRPAEAHPQQQPSSGSQITDPRIHALLAQAKLARVKGSRRDLRRVLEIFDEAVQLDPTYGPAHSGRAGALVALALDGAASPQETLLPARGAAERALELDGWLAEAHAALGCVRGLYEWDFHKALESFERAIKLENANSRVHRILAMIHLVPTGEFEKAESHLHRSQEIDPLTPWSDLDAGTLHYFAGRSRQAAQQLRMAVALQPNLGRAHLMRGRALMRLQDFEAAAEALRKGQEEAGSRVESLAGIGEVAALTGDSDRARQTLELLAQESTRSYVSPVLAARVLAALADQRAALDKLEEAAAVRACDLAWLRVDPAFAELRESGGLRPLLEQIGVG